MDEAASAGHLHVVQWLYKKRPEGCSVYGVHQAAINGHHNVVAFLPFTFPDLKCATTCATNAANRNQFEVIAWLEQHDPDLVIQVVPDMHRRMVALLNAYTRHVSVIAMLDNGEIDDVPTDSNKDPEDTESDDDDNDATVDWLMAH